MTCPADDLLRYGPREGTKDSLSAELLDHLIACPDCQGRIKEFQTTPVWNRLILEYQGQQELPLEIILEQSSAAASFHDSDSRSGSGSPSEVDFIPQDPQSLPNGGRVQADPQIGAELAETEDYQGPHQFLNYRIICRIGSGGVGEVYKAYHTQLRRDDALKLLSKKHAFDSHAQQRFQREMSIIGRLRHPNLIQAYDGGNADGQLYLAMELVDGPNMEVLARSLPQISVADACEVVRQAALGVQHLHENHLVHRDLKPSNLLLAPSGIKVADLGMALLVRKEPVTEGVDESLTASSAILGTGDYMAPEQSHGAHHIDIRADIYSLGCTLYRLLTGKPPFAGQGKGSLISKLIVHLHEPIPEINNRNDVSQELKEVLNRLLDKSPENRYATPREVALALEPFCDGASIAKLWDEYTRSRATEPNRKRIPGPSNATRFAETTVGYTASKLPNPSRRRRIVALWAATAIGITAIAALARPPWFQNEIQQQAAGPALDNSPANNTASSVKSDAGSASSEPKTKIEQPENQIPLGPIAKRWRDTFHTSPTSLKFPGEWGLGSWEINEDLKCLVIQTDQSVRLVKLGTYTPGQSKGMHLGFDLNFPSLRGELGIFVGYGVIEDDVKPTARFQTIRVGILPATETVQKVTVSRTRYVTDGFPHLNGEMNYTAICDVPKGNQKIRLEVTIEGAGFKSISLEGQDLPTLRNEHANRQYPPEQFYGDFGIFTQSNYAWFFNPEFERIP